MGTTALFSRQAARLERLPSEKWLVVTESNYTASAILLLCQRIYSPPNGIPPKSFKDHLSLSFTDFAFWEELDLDKQEERISLSNRVYPSIRQIT